MDVRGLARELDGDEAEAVLARVESEAAFAEARGWPLVCVLQVDFPGATAHEVIWEIERGVRFFSASLRGLHGSMATFSTLMRSRATHERVYVLTTQNRNSAFDLPALGVLAEAFVELDFESLEGRHESAAQYLRHAGMCEQFGFSGSPLELFIEAIEVQAGWFRRRLVRQLLFPIWYLWAVMFAVGRSVEQRYGPRSRVIRRLRGEIMSMPESASP